MEKKNYENVDRAGSIIGQGVYTNRIIYNTST